MAAVNRVSRTFAVSPPPHVVVDYLKDLGHVAQWDPGTRTCERIDSGPVGEGAYWHNVSTMLGVPAETTYKLCELTDRSVVFVGESRSSTAVGTITVEPAGSGSTVTYEAELEMHGSARLLNPMMKKAFEKRAVGTQRQLTAVLNALVIS